MQRLFLVWIGLLVLVSSAFAQPVQDSTYRLSPEDVIRIAIFNDTQINSVVQVGKDGNIAAPFVGLVRAEGKTTTELEADLAQLYIQKLRYRDPKVSVTIERFRTLYASVGGAVARPGKYEIRPTDTVLTVLNNAGGAITSAADTHHATLLRAYSRELIPLDLDALLNRGDLSQNYIIEDGDTLNIPEFKNNRINVLGAVNRPGPIFYRDTLTLKDAIGEAGGDIPYRTKLSEVYVLRERVGAPGKYLKIRSNMVNFISKGDASQNIALQPGDVVYVSETKTPSSSRVGEFASALANTFYILDRFGITLFGPKR